MCSSGNSKPVLAIVFFVSIVALSLSVHATEFTFNTFDDWDSGIFYNTTVGGYLSGYLRLGYANESVTGSLQGFWRLDEDHGEDSTGDTVIDYSHNNIHGTTEDGVKTAVPGILSDNAYGFGEGSEHVYIPHDTSLDSSNFSVSGWFRNEPGSTGVNTIVSKGTEDEMHFSVSIDNEEEDGRLVAKTSSQNGDVELVSSEPLDDGEWHFLAFTYNTEEEATLYIDGENETHVTDVSQPLVEEHPVIIAGENDTDGNVKNHFEGNISLIRFYDEKIGEQDVLERYMRKEDGSVQGAYESKMMEKDYLREWKKLNVSSLLNQNVYANITFRSLDEDNNTIDSQHFEITEDEESFELQVEDSKKSVFEVEGNTSEIEDSWKIDEIVVEHEPANETVDITHIAPEDGEKFDEEVSDVEMEFEVESEYVEEPVDGDVYLFLNDEKIYQDRKETENVSENFSHEETGLDTGNYEWYTVFESDLTGENYTSETTSFEIEEDLDVSFELVEPAEDEEFIGRQDITFEYNVTSNKDGDVSLVKNNTVLSIDPVYSGVEENFVHTEEDVEPGYYEWHADFEKDDEHASSETRNFTVLEKPVINVDISLPETIVEKTNTSVNVTVSNDGDIDSGEFNYDFSVSNYSGSWNSYFSDSDKISLEPGESKMYEYGIDFYQGPNLVNATADTDDEVDKSPESEPDKKFVEDVSSYNIFYGGASKNIRLKKSEEDFSAWISQEPEGTIFFMDTDAQVSFSNLEPLAVDNLDEVDVSLDTVYHNDSIQEVWDQEGDGESDMTGCFTVSGDEVCDVPIAHSSDESEVFKTGIMYEPENDESFDGSQPLVFVTSVEPNSEGSFGTYDYEARIPANLRDQKGETESITIYEEFN